MSNRVIPSEVSDSPGSARDTEPLVPKLPVQESNYVSGENDAQNLTPTSDVLGKSARSNSSNENAKSAHSSGRSAAEGKTGPQSSRSLRQEVETPRDDIPNLKQHTDMVTPRGSSPGSARSRNSKQSNTSAVQHNAAQQQQSSQRSTSRPSTSSSRSSQQPNTMSNHMNTLNTKSIEIQSEKYVPLSFAQQRIKKVLSDWTSMKVEYINNLKRIENEYREAEEEDQEYMKKFVKTYAKKYKALKTRLKNKIKLKEVQVKQLNIQMQKLKGEEVEEELKPEEEELLNQSQVDDAVSMNESEISGEGLFPSNLFDRRTFVTAQVQTTPVHLKGSGNGPASKEVKEVNDVLNEEVGRLKTNLSEMAEYYEGKIKQKDVEMEELTAQIADLESFKRKIIELEEDSDNEEGLDALITESVSRDNQRSRELTSQHDKRLLEELKASASKKETNYQQEVKTLNDTIKSLRAQIVRLTEEKEDDTEGNSTARSDKSTSREPHTEADDEEEDSQQNAELEKKLSVLRDRVAQAKKKLKAVTNQKSVLLDSIENYKKDIEDKENKLKSEQSELEEQQKLVSELREKLAAAEENVETKDDIIAQLEKKLGKMSGQQVRPQTSTGGDPKKELKKMRALQLAKEQELASTVKKLENLQQKLEKTQSDFNKLESKHQKSLQESENNIQQLKDQQQQLVDKMKVTIDKKVEKATAKKNKELETLKNHHDTFKSKVGKIAKELEKARKEKDAIQQELTDLQEKSKNSTDEVDRLKKQMEEDAHWKEDAVQSQKQLKKFTKKYDEMEGQLHKAEDKARKLYNKIEDMKGKIRVYARVRPFNSKETDKEVHKNILDFVDNSTVSVVPKEKSFKFNRVFNPQATQDEVFADCKDLVQSSLDGYNVCIFAYGQTGTGKTWTITGKPGNDEGILPKAVREAFSVAQRKSKLFDVKLEVQMVELYLDDLQDLLAAEQKKFKSRVTPSGRSSKIEVKKDSSGNVVITNSVIIECSSPEEMLEVYRAGERNRKTRATGMNDDSSRSHLIFAVHITAVNKKTQDTFVGKLSLVDLAGSESRKKTGLTDQTALDEAKAINMSLLHLGECINSLSTGKRPNYRNSLLTQLLADSLGGTAKTLMFVCVGPSAYNTDTTFKSLQYAERAKKIQNDVSKKAESQKLSALKKSVTSLGEALRYAVENKGNLPNGVTLATFLDEVQDFSQVK